jgi:co-chaperonin GroES (HSP10)
LVLPATVKEKEEIQSGYVVKTGPGYPIPSNELDEPWKEDAGKTQYIGMQARKGDLAIFLKSQSHEIEFENEKYIIIPHGSILLLIRDELDV